MRTIYKIGCKNGINQNNNEKMTMYFKKLYIKKLFDDIILQELKRNIIFFNCIL